MELKQRYVLTGDCFLNNRYLEKGTVVLWPPSQANLAMVPCDSQGRPKTREEAREVEEVQVVEVEKPAPRADVVELSADQRADLIVVAVRDVLEDDNDADYTKDGEIRLQAIRDATKIEDVSREDINAALKTVEQAAAEEAEAAPTKAAGKGKK